MVPVEERGGMARILVLWNQVDDDVYEHYRRENRRTVEWDPSIEVEPWETVEDELLRIVRALRAGGHEASLVNIRDSFRELVAAVDRAKPDLVMNLIEFYGEDPEHEHHVPAIFELLGVGYTGNRPTALSLCQKKPQAKALLAAQGIPVPRGIVVESAAPADLGGLRYPLIVKPAFDDASGGIDTRSVVHDRAALDARIAGLLGERRGAVLVEEYIEGREIHCAILGETPLPLYEMQFKGGVGDDGQPLPRIITYRAKWDPYSREHHAVEGKCPVDDLAPDLVSRIQSIALRAYRALGCRDYARVDMRLDPATGDAYVLEVNPNPDLAGSCAFAASGEAHGWTYPQLICELARIALERNQSPQIGLAGIDQLLREYQAKKRESG
jgi:D-alanine-D-alanine ligase